MQPLRSPHGATRERHAIRCAMSELHSLTDTGERYCVIAHHIATAKYGEADRATTTFARCTMTRVFSHFVERHVASHSDRTAKGQRSA